jgi:hypothetical protein
MKPIADAVPSQGANARSSASPAKCEANRKNALKSTGPKTRMGKRNVRLNALKHGFYAHEMTIRPEYKTEINSLQSALHAQLRPKTALQQLAFKAVSYCAWHCELAARLDMRRVNALLFPPDKQEPSPNSDGKPTMDSWYAASPESLRKGVRFLDHLELEVQRCGDVPEELKDSVRQGFGPRFLDLLEQPKSTISLDALLLAHHLQRHADTFRRPLPPQTPEGPELIIDPQQSLQATLRLIDLMKEFLNNLRQIDGRVLEEPTRARAIDSPLRHFADATRALHRAVDWYQHLVSNAL